MDGEGGSPGQALVQPPAEQGTLAEAGLEHSARGALLVSGSQQNGVPETACRGCPGEEKEISQLFTSFFTFWSSTAGVCGKQGGLLVTLDQGCWWAW